jgi:hypothetical protein
MRSRCMRGIWVVVQDPGSMRIGREIVPGQRSVRGLHALDDLLRISCPGPDNPGQFA